MLIMLGSRDTRLGPWVIMSGRRLLMSGPKLLHWEYGRGLEINMSGPDLLCLGPYQLCRARDNYVGSRLIMSEPLFMSGPRDNYVGAPFLLFWGSEIILLGPNLSCEDPDLLCPGPKIIMWKPRLCWVPHLSCRDPEIWGPWLIMWGAR